MIHYSLLIKSKNWNVRKKKVGKIIYKIIKQKEKFNFKKNIDYYCNIILMNDSLIKKYNKIYKKINKSTDVLTFVSDIQKKDNKKEKYCDIMFSAETIAKDAEQNKINFYDHFAHMVIHTLLHVTGHKHKKNKDFLLMQKKEIQILKKLNIANPY
tara:strand:+ start:1266 stop:1730 length:465 start_codon:yes stop_codon:yes gene_type:complete